MTFQNKIPPKCHKVAKVACMQILNRVVVKINLRRQMSAAPVISIAYSLGEHAISCLTLQNKKVKRLDNYSKIFHVCAKPCHTDPNRQAIALLEIIVG